MRARNNAVINAPAILYQYFTDSVTGKLAVLDAEPTVEIFTRDPRELAGQTPVLTPTPEPLVGISGAYGVIAEPTANGWHWDKWTYIIDGKSYTSLSSFYVAARDPYDGNSYPMTAPTIYLNLATKTVRLGDIQFVKFHVCPRHLPAPEVRMLLGGTEILAWNEGINFENDGFIHWLVDFSSPELREGIYTIELKFAYGLETRIISPLYLKVEQNG